ncbi:MAG: hypothetical protein HY908_36005, partial [Myxococcales bacterium]|nr:hypothetical protein [Myxococcales bacterium]
MTAARSPHRPPERAGAATPCRLAPLALVALLALSACPRDRTPLPKGPPPDYETPRGYDAPGLDGPATASLPDPGDLPPPPPAPAPAAPPGSASAAPAAAT